VSDLAGVEFLVVERQKQVVGWVEDVPGGIV
jgi:hypothetical protein